MAQKVDVLLLDDLDGTPAEETVPFTWGGVDYEIDLSRSHLTHYDNMFDTLVQAARRVKASTSANRRPRRRTPTAAPAAPVTPAFKAVESNGDGEVDSKTVKEWAVRQGLMTRVTRGRVKDSVRQAYEAAH